MRRVRVGAVLLCAAQACTLSVVGPVCAKDKLPPLPDPSPVRAVQAAPPPPVVPLSEAHPVVAAIRAKLAEPAIRKDADAGDLAALEVFYGARRGPPLWMTDMGFSARGQAALFEIEKADDWGLDAAAFELPPPGRLPKTPEAQALAEIKLDLAILKYARFARGDRFNPSELSELLDQEPFLLDPQTVLAEIDVAEAPATYLRSLHPKHEQFRRLRQALLKLRSENRADDKAGPDTVEIKRILINMERWRWMPEDLGELYVWINTPEFMMYLVKDGKTIFSDKTLVGTIGNATPVFSADMKTIVFNPDWIAPESVLLEKLRPFLIQRNYAFLKKHKLSVSYRGRPVNVARVNWRRVNIRKYTFTQKAGPWNNLGKVKFLYPNKHVVYMHDTLPIRKKVFQKDERAIGYGCVRMEKPYRLAEILLAEDKGWPGSKVKDLWDKSVNSPVTIDRRLPVHTTYFTAVIDEAGEVSTFADLYGLDHALAVALFGNAEGFPKPPPEKKRKLNVAAPVGPTAGGLGRAVVDLLSN